MDRFCPACGTQRADGSSFCSQCGHRFEPAAAAAELPAAAAPPVPDSPPPGATAASVPPPLPEGPPPLPQPVTAAALPPGGQSAWAAAPPAPVPAAGTNPALKIGILVFALASIGFGIWKILDAFHVFNGHSSYSSSYAPGYTPPASTGSSTTSLSGGAISDSWIEDTWTPENGVRCATWVRFNSDHTLIDEHGGTGSWYLSAYNSPSGELTMTIGSQPQIHGTALRLDQDMMRIGTQTWRRASC